MNLRYVSSRELANLKTFFFGVDLAQANDYTALCLLELELHPTGEYKADAVGSILSGINGGSGRAPEVPVYAKHYTAVHLERLPKGTPYPAQVTRIKKLHDHLTEQKHKVHLVADATGVGRPVLDLLRAAKLNPVGVTITGGDSMSRDGRDYRVPKVDLVEGANVLLQSKRLSFLGTLPEAETLIGELKGFNRAVTLKANVQYGNDVGPWRESPHDDLVLALALATWYGERHRDPEPVQPSVNLARPRRW